MNRSNAHFAQIPTADIEVSTFDRSHGIKTTFDSGWLVPIYLDEVLPGDRFSVKASLMAKMLSPMVTAPMDNLYLDTQWFYVPSRLLWNNFTKMMGERLSPQDSIDYLLPTISSGPDGFAVGSLADYLGIPPGFKNMRVNALPFRAYAKIWDDWYRSEQIQSSRIKVYEDLGDGNPNNINWNLLLRRGKRHDYFTSCLPAPQLGPGVELPLVGTAPVVGDGKALRLTDGSTYMQELAVLKDKGLVAARAEQPHHVGDAYTGTGFVDGNKFVGLSTRSGETGVVADLTKASAVTINSLRNAFQLQRLLERDARSGGCRFVSIIKAHFNVVCPDARLQRSEYLGGSSQLINITQQFQLSGTGDTPQGNRIGTAQTFSEVSWTKSFTEHGYILGIASVRADLTYQQGLNRLWTRRGRYDFYWPALAHLGEQAVKNSEIYATHGSGGDDDTGVFGYQERYAEYRYHPSMVTGKLRSQHGGLWESLDVWHFAQYFNALPRLNADFINEYPPLKRTLAVQDEPEFILDGVINCKSTRPMPVYSVPGLVDHF